MSVEISKPIIYVFNEINIGKFNTVKHFELDEQSTSSNRLGKFLNISCNRDFAKSKPDYWIKIKEGNRWQTFSLTGLFKTEFENVYKGDANRKKHLLVFKFEDNQSKVLVYYFENYYTNVLSNVKHLINI